MYAAAQDCIDRYGAEALRELADDPHADALAWSRLEAGLADASDEVDAYLGARHPLPLAPVPRLVERLCVDIGIYRRSLAADTRTDEQRQRYEDAIALLRRIESGEASLGAADPDPPAEAESSSVQFASAPRVMAREDLKRVL